MPRQDRNKGKQKKRKQAQARAKAQRLASGFEEAAAAGTSCGKNLQSEIPLRRASQQGAIKAKARQGDPDAQAAYGFYRLVGLDGKDPDPDEAAQWFQKAIDGGSDEACASLAALCLAGRGAEEDPARARELFALGAERGNSAARHGLARCLAQGIGDERDPDAAARLYEQICGEGLHEASAELMQLRLAMPDDPEGFARALDLLQKASRAHCPQAMRLYASLLLDGRGVDADPAAGAALLDETTRLQGSGDWDEGPLDQLLQAARGPLEDAGAEQKAEAQEEGMAWRAIEGAWKDLAAAARRQDLPEAVRAMALARLKENWESGGSAMMHGLGIACLSGLFTAQDFAKAREAFSESAACLHPESRAYLGAMDFWGLGCERDMAGGVAAMEQAAEDGSLSASRFLARIFAKGDGGWPEDAGKAELYRHRAEELAAAAREEEALEGELEDELEDEAGDGMDGTDLDWEDLLAKPPFEDGSRWLSLW